MIGCVDFSQFTDENGDNEMYESFIINVENDKEKNQYIILDENNHTVWICWYEKELNK